MDELTENQQSQDDKLFFDGGNLLNDVANVANVATLDLSQAVDAGQEAIDAAILIIDTALAACSDNPGLLGSPEFAGAVKLISTKPELWFEYRTKIKAAKPSGVPMTAIDDMTATQSAGDERQDSAAAELIALALDRGELFFDPQSSKAFINANIDGVNNTLAIGSKAFVEWLSFSYYMDTKNNNPIGKSASEAAIKQACFALSGVAKHEGENKRVYLRVADYNDGHYIFIGDEKLQVIEVLPTGWRILEKSPLLFWRPSSLQSLPIPITGGDLSKLWGFVNIPEDDRLLVLAWLLECFRAGTPFPILGLSGTQGSVKSSTQNKLRQLVDNNAVNLRAAPKSIEDVFVSAGCNWLASYENLSHITPAMQDAFCTLATGGGWSGRTLYTNDEETIIEVKRPVIINSIPNVITAQDLTDRAISIECPRIAYREESEINAAWDEAKPAIFGGLMDLFVKTLALMPSVKLINPPRMADFTRLGEAMAQAFGHQPGTFDALYKANRAESIGRAMESSPVAVAVCEMVDSHNGSSLTVFHGTVKSLLDELANKHRHDSESWPKSPKGLSDALKRQAPALATLGIEIISGNRVERIGTNRGLPITIKKSGNVGNIGNIDLKNSTPKEKFTPLKSVAFEDSAVV